VCVNFRDNNQISYDERCITSGSAKLQAKRVSIFSCSAEKTGTGPSSSTIQIFIAIDLHGGEHQNSGMESSPERSCDDSMSMPFTQEVLEHIRIYDSCHSLFNAVAIELDHLFFEREHRN
jgi:hypothetical protein